MAGPGPLLRLLAVALVALLIGSGCGAGGPATSEADNPGDEAWGPEPTSTVTSSTVSPSASTTEAEEPETTSAYVLGPDEFEVPVDKGLVEALPVFSGRPRIHADEVFDVRLCDGTEAVDVPLDQAAVTFVDGPTSTTTAVYRFVEGYGADYALEYVESLLVCATPTSVVDALDLGDDSYLFTIDDGSGPMLVLVVVDRDWVWLVQRRSATGEVGFTPAEQDEIQAAIEA